MALLCLASSAFAQRPEFWLGVKFFVNDDPSQFRTIYFGYDATASDSLEGSKWFGDIVVGGEQMYPPPFENDDARFTGYTIDRGGELGDGSPIDVRKKTDSSGFILNYEISLTTRNETQSATLSWDRTLIPETISHIFLEPATISPGPGRKRTDMKVENSLNLPNRDSISKYSKTLISLYYNKEPVDGVRSESMLERSVAIYPNPISESSIVSIFLEKSTDVTISIVDAAGRKIKDISSGSLSGLSAIPLPSSLFPVSGAYFVTIKANGMSAERLVQIFK